MNHKNDVLSREKATIEASMAYAQANKIHRDGLDDTRNALFAGFIIPPKECHRWADAMFPDGPHVRDTDTFDPIIPLYFNDKFEDVTQDPHNLPFHVVANATGPLNVMYVMDVVWGNWRNPLAMYDIDEVFDEKLWIALDEGAAREASRFLTEDMQIRDIGSWTTYYSFVL
ncbi:hypothetical protein GGX14DRAFT_564243 [Mycena pura]|uniref:Uncharacterized protein n=1 Tax=Mycena pura TaxID=153505 RepID=A0AAD6VK64_9AGAR|nr:hypothetical protein GGX14DRAFT_564243 [Mycena pura]